MSLLLTIALIALVLTVAWKHCYGLARFAGIILILRGLAWLVAGAAIVPQLGAVAAGVMLWLGAQLFGAYRHRVWGSPWPDWYSPAFRACGC